MITFLKNPHHDRRPYMWGIAILLLILFLIVISLFFNQEKLQSAFGEYEFESLLYLSPLSSSTFGYAESKMQDTRFTISESLFEIDDPDEDRYFIEQPIYVKEKMTGEMIKAFEKSTFDEVTLSDFKEKYRYAIYTADDMQTNYYLYTIDDQIWLSSFADNTADKSEITTKLWKLKTQNE